ncbi:COP9 signalosome complex subunit 3-like protein [Dinothrombium tinctorium]|uniref:COP9 signalosome complex subunit 3 n=1 Tax=Dinothrombium tinctorium TaxID=1965070 RepID=A0A443R5C0_9ACAR|nr:COP9 signalosome complex subunit 3-like protein [Dinothrombium tinctorium]RWS10491.1 COP9 signalosome complex subunit 3-like protein [Dinothrombium tinctorium]
MSSALEQFVVTVRSLSSQGSFDQLYEYCSKNSDVLVKHSAHLDDALATLDLQEHSLGILTILCVKMSLNHNQAIEQLYAQIQEFITECNGEQIRVAPDTFAELCHYFTLSLVERRQPMRGIDLLCKAITKIQLSPTQLTSIHADLFQLCLLAKCLKPALYFLDMDITDISKEGGQFDVKYFLLYYYYGGIIYASLKKYERALYFFEVAITTPSMAVSHIMLEAYKKYVLVALILYGKVPPFPKYTSQVVTRFIKPLSAPYNELVSAYATNNPEEVIAVINRHSETLTRETNMGLVKQCLSSLHKKNIQRLTKTFLTLSLSDMANRVQLANAKEAENYILRMIEDKEIFASINQKDGMVVFLDNPEKYNTATMFRRLEDDMKVCMYLEDKLRKMDQEIAVSAKYIQKVRVESE